MVLRKNGWWWVFSKEGKRLAGPYKTQAEALKRLKEIEGKARGKE